MSATALDLVATWLVELDRDLKIVAITQPASGSHEVPFIDDLPVGYSLAVALGGSASAAEVSSDLLRGGEVKSFRYFIEHELLGRRHYSLSSVPLLTPAGRIMGHRCSIADLTYALETAAARDRSEAELSSIIDACPNFMMVKDIDGRFVRLNTAARDLLSTWTDTPLGSHCSDYLPDDLAEQFAREDSEVLESEEAREYEHQILFADGTHTFLTVKFPIYDRAGSIVGLGASGVDITERKRLESELDRLANFDDLTELPNRRLARQRLDQAVLLAQHVGQRVGLIVADIADFKMINDTLGHAVGDQILIETAWRLQDSAQVQDTVARVSGDEFSIVLAELDGGESLATVMARIQENFSRPILVNGKEIYVGITTGSAIYPDDADGAEQLIRGADLAMATAKAAGMESCHYAAEIRSNVERKAEISRLLRRAVQRQEFTLLYQPLVDSITGQIVAAEALIRWNSPDLGMVRPDHFIPIAEQSGVIGAIGTWTISRACRDAAAWNRNRAVPISVAVNVSPKQLLNSGIAETIAQALAETGLAPNLLKVEITESSLIADVDRCSEVLEEIRALGVVLALDDFGTGYSALSYLEQFRFDVLKLDQSFVRKASPGSTAAALTASIIAMAKCLGMSTVGEGVETHDQAELLRANGCDLMQGYLYSAPVDRAKLLTLLGDLDSERAAA